jgi:tetratricopeptide (TPR) repeat protein
MSNGALAENALTPTLLARLDTPDSAAGLAEVDRRGLASLSTAEQLTNAALERAEYAPESAAHWLTLAQALHTRLDGKPALQAQITYAQARLSLRSGDLVGAERLIRQAQSLWQQVGVTMPLARSYLGLTQILTMQGRYAEAESAIHSAIAGLPTTSPQQAQARLNLANLLRRQERHNEALSEYRAAQTIYAEQLRVALASGDRGGAAQMQGALARLAVNQANALMYLDQPAQAETALQDAALGFAEAGDSLNQGRTHTNLGTLYLRTGRYSQALAALQQAATELLGETALADAPPDRLRQADVLFLERANAYVALNLIPEAIEELEHAIRLFETTQQPYELGQSYYSLGLLRLRNGQERLAQAALDTANDRFVQLSNKYWQNRVALALATLAFRQSNVAEARQQVTALLAQNDSSAQTAQTWDTSLRVEACLLETLLALTQNDVAAAQTVAAHAATHLGVDANGDAVAGFSLPHLRLQWEHMQGCIALAAGQPDQAITYFQRAIRMLESQRVSLPLEEFKTAFLEDKRDIYSDLIFAILGQTGQDAAATVTRIFAISEQGRARTLLDRLLAAGDSPQAEDESDSRNDNRQAQSLRTQLHWLYNQLLGGQDDAQHAARRQEIQTKEAALQRVEWKRTPLQRQTEAVELSAFQAALGADEQAVVYFVGRPSIPGLPTAAHTVSNGEVMAFVIDRQTARLVRHLTTPDRLGELATELHFQLGRIELGPAYAERHRERLLAGVRSVLAEMYRLLVAPLAADLWRTVLHALSSATGDEKVPGTFCPSESVDGAPASEIREVPGTLFSGQVRGK